MQSSRTLLHDKEVDAATYIEYYCSYCNHLLQDMEVRVQPCVHCGEWHFVVQK